MIKITRQDVQHQYDEQDRAITTWHAKACNWIVNVEFENEKIDWWGNNNDFPGGYIWSEFVASHPNWDKNPDIIVSWYWNTKEACIKTFGQPHTFLPYTHHNYSNYWDVQHYPYTHTNQWGYIDEPKETTVERFGKHCEFHKFADRVVVKYNGEILHDGKLE